ncbi:hypothetical protein [uncultured Paenibacillus sp.]|uniref:hypothetical protein n=1 Tax=uncultured Paenibacillus sp. TaxID=227322 RepID=UPI0025DF903E|nr:hypothetical protein [uncultured Paenibacillus sp.]
MPHLILNIGMQASLALPIVINGFHVCRSGSPGTERSTSQAYSPAARISSSAAPSDWLRCKYGLMILSALDELNAKSVADGFFICSGKAAFSLDTLFTCSGKAVLSPDTLFTCSGKAALSPDTLFTCSGKAVLSPDTLFTCSTNTAKMQQFH